MESWFNTEEIYKELKELDELVKSQEVNADKPSRLAILLQLVSEDENDKTEHYPEELIDEKLIDRLLKMLIDVDDGPVDVQRLLSNPVISKRIWNNIMNIPAYTDGQEVFLL